MNKIMHIFMLAFFAAAPGVYPQQQLSTVFPDDGLRPADIQISDGGARLTVVYNNYTIVWDIDRREMIRRTPKPLPYDLSVRTLSPDGSLLAVGNGQILYLYDAGTQRPLKQFTVFDYVEDPNSGGPGGFTTLMAWEQEKFRHIYFTPDSRNVVVVSGSEKIVYVDIANGTMVTTRSFDRSGREPSLGSLLDINIPQGRAVYGINGSLTILDFTTGQKEAEFRLEFNNMILYPGSFSFSAGHGNRNGILLASSPYLYDAHGKHYTEQYLFDYDYRSRNIVYNKKLNTGGGMIRLTNNENIAVLLHGGSVCLTNIQTGTELAHFLAYEDDNVLVVTPENYAGIRSRIPDLRSRAFQLGTFPSYQDAQRMVRELEGKGFNAVAEMPDSNNYNFWTVVINCISPHGIAEFRRKLENAGFSGITVGFPRP